MRRLAFVLAAVAGVAALTVAALQLLDRSHDRRGASPPLPPPLIRVEAVDLDTHYATNAANADRVYRNKRALVRGEVAQTGRDTDGRAFVLLKTPGRGVRCYLAAGDGSELLPGERIAVAGVCDGTLLEMVVLRGCEVSDVGEEPKARKRE